MARFLVAPWKAFTIAFIVAIVIHQFIRHGRWLSQHDERHHAQLPFLQHLPTPNDNNLPHWNYNPERDRNDHGMSGEQCTRAFPELYAEIERAVAHWKSINITPASIEMPTTNDGSVRMLLYGNQLRIIRTRGMYRADFRHRILSVVHQIHRALEAVESRDRSIPDIEFNIIINDIPNLEKMEDRALWAFTRESGNKYHDAIWLIPDFHWFVPDFQSVPESFREMQSKSRSHDSIITNKIPKVVWRGVEWTNPVLRGALLNATAGQPWADVEAMYWKNESSILSVDEFCKYAYLVNTEGRSWSARLTHILNCDSVPIVHDPQWIAHYYHLLSDDINCVRVERNFSDLGEKVQYYSDNSKEAQKIADNSVATFRDRYTSPAATSCYWRQLFHGWNSVAFAPATFELTGPLAGAPRLRGISYDAFMEVSSLSSVNSILTAYSLHVNNVDYPFPTND